MRESGMYLIMKDEPTVWKISGFCKKLRNFPKESYSSGFRRGAVLDQKFTIDTIRMKKTGRIRRFRLFTLFTVSTLLTLFNAA